jgi:ATP-dependent Clp protease ATP-binding subunit ClpC
MSELQDEAALPRLLGDPEQRDDGGALTDLIRKQPFSVVLLDEFEKSHPRIWDLFLQVFDDGRLTDRQGRIADFRHALIVLTSNLGSDVADDAGVGFVERGAGFHPGAVLRAVRKSFRKEFLNRLDRIVVFRPLSRDTMRQILRKELDAVFGRRGLRNRSWAAEWDESAIEFLLERGFTADLGARPLRRAIERHLLTPLAQQIVERRFPEGDQFLFIRGASAGLEVEFVDPDGPPDEQSQAVEPLSVGDRSLRLENVVLAPRGSAAELELLRFQLGRVTAAVESEEFKGAKHAALELTGDAGFWDSPDRFSILDEAEYIDRIEGGVRAARSLIGRLESLEGRSSVSVRPLFGRLAQQLYLLGHACDDVRLHRPHDAFLLVEAGHAQDASPESSNRFASRLGAMYRGWADRRGMRWEPLGSGRRNPREPFRLMASITGYAAFSLLEGESGLHVFESQEASRRPARRRLARVLVASHDDGAPPRDPDGLRVQAAERLDQTRAAPTRVVRYYRETPSPLVRDRLRGWRTGKLERVLAGDFDLML